MNWVRMACIISMYFDEDVDETASRNRFTIWTILLLGGEPVLRCCFIDTLVRTRGGDDAGPAVAIHVESLQQP